MLQFDGTWRFDSPGPISSAAVADFGDLINRIVSQGNRKRLLEHFKSHFAGAAGVSHYPSSDEGWAASDLDRLMDQAAANAPLFIDAFFSACEALRLRDASMGLPDVHRVNRILAENDAGYRIEPPYLVAVRDHPPIAVPPRPPSLAAQAQELVFTSLQTSDRLLVEGRGRQAVQESLWLLESVVTAFRGMDFEAGSLQGRYFNKLIAEMRGRTRGTTLDQILGWIVALHGFLSSPTGGGIRHGVDLAEGLALQEGEARLYCNLIRSYITFLISEHERLSRTND